MKTTKILMTAAASGTMVLGMMGPALADNAIINIGRNGTLSSTHKIAYVPVKVSCSEDTVSGSISGYLTQVTHGSVQTAYASIDAMNAVECTGEEEWVNLPVRRPTGGYKWVTGAARAYNVTFTSTDPSGTFSDTAKGRTVMMH